MSKRDLWAVVAADIPTKSQYAEQEMANGIRREARGRWLETQSFFHCLEEQGAGVSLFL